MKKNYFELIQGISDKELKKSLYVTQILLLTIALFLGIFLFDSYQSFFDLFNWKDPNVIVIGVSMGLAVVLIDSLLMKLLPASWYDDRGLNNRIFQKRKIVEIAGIAAVVAAGEEILFRGVIQTHFGLITASILFALVHYRYLFRLFLFLNVTVLSFFIGFIYWQTENLAVTMIMHFTIDFLLGCMIKLKFDKNKNEQEGKFDE
nr:type II CAAX endopeptidase family protein [uncultured Bacillus sp.]